MGNRWYVPCWTDDSLINSFAVIRAGLVSGKLSQTTQSLYIIRATSQNFEQEQWRALEQRLIAWKTGLASILDVVTNAKKMGNQVAAQT
jgi:translation initiation factor 3 subunit M